MSMKCSIMVINKRHLKIRQLYIGGAQQPWEVTCQGEGKLSFQTPSSGLSRTLNSVRLSLGCLHDGFPDCNDVFLVFPRHADELIG